MPKPRLRPEQEPIGAWFAKRHSHTPGIQDTSPSDHPVKLHVRVPADEHRDSESLNDWQETLFGRQAGKNLRIVAWCSMAEKDLGLGANLDAKDFRPARDQLLLFWVQLPRHPPHRFASLLWNGERAAACPLSKHRNLGIASDELYGNAQLQQAGQAFRDIGPRTTSPPTMIWSTSA